MRLFFSQAQCRASRIFQLGIDERRKLTVGKPFKLQFLYFSVAETISHAELY